MRPSRRASTALAAAGAALALSACNPITMFASELAPQEYYAYGWYAGPPEAWMEAAVSGAPGIDVWVAGGVERSFMTGPADRWCTSSVDGSVVPCSGNDFVVFNDDVQWVPANDGATFVRLITVYDEEPAEVFAMCTSQETWEQIPCPGSLEITIRTVGWDGQLVGDLEPGEYAGGAGTATAPATAKRR
jgi:hypothetical protein